MIMRPRRMSLQSCWPAYKAERESFEIKGDFLKLTTSVYSSLFKKQARESNDNGFKSGGDRIYTEPRSSRGRGSAPSGRGGAARGGPRGRGGGRGAKQAAPSERDLDAELESFMNVGRCLNCVADHLLICFLYRAPTARCGDVKRQHSYVQAFNYHQMVCDGSNEAYYVLLASVLSHGKSACFYHSGIVHD